MKNINEVWQFLVQKLQQENQNLQQYNNTTFKNKTPGIGEMVFNLSPVTNLVKDHYKNYYGGLDLHYNYSLQIGCATKVDVVQKLKDIFDEIKEVFNFDIETPTTLKVNDRNLFLKIEDKSISVNLDFDGRSYNALSIKVS